MIRPPLIVTYPELCALFAKLHLWQKPYLDSLHDVWASGAPTPDSIIRNPRHYDERKRQPGNHVKRIVPESQVRAWAETVGAARGLYTPPAP